MSIDQLPSSACAKLVALEQAAADARALLVTATERRGRADERALLLRQKLKTTDPEGPRHAELITEISRAESELAHLADQQRERSEKHANAAQIVAEIRAWLTQLPAHTVLEAASISVPPLRKGDTAPAVIERTRELIAAAQRELQQLRYAPPTRGEVESLIRDHVKRLVRAGSPNIVATHQLGLAVNWFGSSPGLPQPTLTPVQVAAMMAWYDPKQLVERLLVTHADLPSAGDGISAAAKKTRIAELTEHIMRLERTEEFHIEAAARNGQELPRRPAAAPAAVLGVRAVSSRVAAVVAA